jgi:hypothetical protein
MKTNEVRQGNYAYYKYWNPNPSNPSWEFEVVEIVGVLKETFYFKLKNDKRTHKIGELHPIPLNEDFLISKFKLEQNTNGTFYINNRLIGIRQGEITDLETGKEFKYVHRFQNFIFELTDRELTINEK